MLISDNPKLMTEFPSALIDTMIVEAIKFGGVPPEKAVEMVVGQLCDGAFKILALTMARWPGEPMYRN